MPDSLPCPCGQTEPGLSGHTLPYTQCCGVWHQQLLNNRHAPDAAVLMRSRYSAYSLGLTGYIVETTLPALQPLMDTASIAQYCRQIYWQELQVLSHLTRAPYHAQVHFIATGQTLNGEPVIHEERSGFVKASYRWYFIDPSLMPKQSPNNTCICGSGLKAKKCCALLI